MELHTPLKVVEVVEEILMLEGQVVLVEEDQTLLQPVAAQVQEFNQHKTQEYHFLQSMEMMGEFLTPQMMVVAAVELAVLVETPATALVVLVEMDNLSPISLLPLSNLPFLLQSDQLGHLP